MDFPDLPHLRQLQKDLWQWPSSRATVMVGAGFSRNSVPLPGVTTSFPTWPELAKAMFDDIYPACPNETAEQKRSREKQFDRSNPLRLASEYEATFDPQRLKSLIRTRIPDTDHKPGNIHDLLLQLPWKEVFTTNYDTLLERTEVPGRVYQTVTTVTELTTAISPRIIKLHGSFPSLTQFIITEDDYRTYPKDFVLFINTVRQSLIENTFVLVGFSGDDPNFLQWTGWIRDELGSNHAPIYLVSPLSLSNVQRSLLAKRGVKPIDLSPVFSSTTRPDGIHASAIEWFLRSLLAAKPQRPEAWLKTKRSAAGNAEFEPPIFVSGFTEPEKVDLSGSSQSPLEEATVIKVIERWRFERNRYPGWLIPTNEIRSLLWQETGDWITPLIKSAGNWPPADRLLLFREINWRLEISMIPLFSDWITPFESAIKELFLSLKDGMPTKPSTKAMRSINVSDTEVAEAWLEIAFALLRESREDYHSERWNAFNEKIGQVVGNHLQFADRNYYEQALWRMWNIERSQAKDVLAKWSPSPRSPLAVMWKAGLLAELDDLSEARSLLRTALREIRKSLHNSQGRNIDLLSLEGWCTYLLFAVTLSLEGSEGRQLQEEFSERWQELEAWDCSPWPLKQYFDTKLSKTPPIPKKPKQIVRSFDPGRRTITHHFGSNIGPWLPAFACIRLYEQVGIPLHLPFFNFSGSALRNACKWVAPFTGFWSPALLIRAGKRDDLTKHDFLNRVQVAAMKPDLARSLNKWAMQALKREISSLSGNVTRTSGQESLLEVLPEVLSRLALKLESADLQEAFSVAIELHAQPGIASNISLHQSCEPWFERLFKAADDRQLLAWLPKLIRFPLNVGSDRLSNPYPNPWPDPMTHFPIERLRIADDLSSELEAEINESTEWLLERAKSERGEERRRAMMRLIDIFDAKLMTEEQRNRLGALLWEKTSEHGLPDLPDLHCFKCLHLPSPAEVDVVPKVKAHIFSIAPIGSVSIGTKGTISISRQARQATADPMIFNAALASKAAVTIPYEPTGIIEWSWDEAKKLWERSKEWWDNEKIALSIEKSSPFFGTEHISDNLERVGTFLARAVLPKMDSASEDEWNRVLAFLSETRQRGVYLSSVLPYVLLHRSSEREKVIETVLDDLSSDDEKAVQASARAIRHWVHLAVAGFLDIPPKTVIDELIRRVVFRRPEGIQTCLNQLAVLLIEKPDFVNSGQVNLVVASITPWSQATCLPLSEERNGDFSEEERPEIRALLGRLASALSIWLKKRIPNQPEPPEISRLRQSYKSDPLPEVRRAFDTWKQ